MADIALLRKLDQGDISNVVSEVKAALCSRGQSELGHRALIRLSNLCISGSGGKKPVITDDNEALELVLLCCKAISAGYNEEDNVPAKSRTIISFFNVYSRFCANENIDCAMKLVDEVYPILKKMVASMSDSDQKYIHGWGSKSHNLIISAADSIFKEGSRARISLFDLFDRMLLISSLSSPDNVLPHVASVLRNLSVKCEKYYGLQRAEEILSFNNTLLDKLVSFSILSSQLKNVEAIDKVFGMLVMILHQFLRANIEVGFNESNTLSNWQKLSAFFSVKSDSRECFELIGRIVRLFLFQNSEKLFENELQYFCDVFKGKECNISSAFSWVLFISGSIVCVKNSTICSKIISCGSLPALSAFNCFTKLLSQLLLSCFNATCSGANGEVCLFKSDVWLAFKSRITFTSLCLEYQKKNKEDWLDVVKMVESSFKCLENMLKHAYDGKCVKSAALERSLYDTYWSVGSTCYNNEDWEHACLFFLPALRFYYTVERDLNSAELSRHDAISSRLSHCFEKQGQTKEAKAAILLNTLLHLETGTPQNLCFQEQWSGLQDRKPTDAKTSDQFLKGHRTFLKTMCPTFSLNLKLVPGLLLWELSSYAKHKMGNSSIVLNTWHALEASKPSALQLIEGSALAGQALFSSSDTVAWHNVISASLSTWLCEVNSCDRPAALCAVAVYYHIKFLILAQRHFDENESSVEELTIYSRNPSTVRKPGDVIDPKDVCQIRSSFSNLTLKREQELMDLLETAVNYWDESIKAGLTIEDHSNHAVVSLSGDYLLQAAYLHSLWGHSAGAAKTFKVCCSFAEKMHLDDLHIQALSGLMTTIEVKQECIAESEALLKRLKNHPKIQYFSLVHSTSRAFQALRNKSYEEGAKALNSVINLKPTSSSVWCHTYLNLLQASYSLVPKTKFGSGCRSARYGLSLSIRCVQDRRLSQSPLIFAALIHQALLSALWIGRYYRQHLMPREARGYLKPELMLALKLGLATRAAEFICELAFIDLLTEKVDEAKSKISDLEGIIQTSHKGDSTEDQLDDEFDDMFDSKTLNVPKDTRNVLGASPGLVEKFQLPTNSHDILCKCYSCKNSSVQNVLLMFGHLQAKINMLTFEARCSMKIYHTLFRASEKARRKSIKNVLLQDSLLHQHDIACSEVLLWLDFVDMLVMYGKDHEAKRQNESVLGLLRNLRTDDNQLISIILEQKLSISKILKEKEKKERGECDLSGSHCQSTPGIMIVDRTPENTCISSSLIQGKRRQPLKPVETPNRCIMPLTDQQFFTPKAPVGGIKILFNDDNDEDDDIFKDEDNIVKAKEDIFKDSGNKILKNAGKGALQHLKENTSIPTKKGTSAPKKPVTTTSRKVKEENGISRTSRSVRVSRVKAGTTAEESASTSNINLGTRSKPGGLSVRSKPGVRGESSSAVENVKGESAKDNSRTNLSAGTSRSTRVTRQKKI